MKHILRTLALGLLLTSSAIHAADTIEARDTWVREAPPSVTVLAAYLQLVNHGAADRVLNQVTSPAFAHVEIHRTEEHGGMAHMIKIPDVAVPANGTLIFQKGGLHLMLIDPKTLLKAGDSVVLTLHFADGATLEVIAPVRKADAGSHEHMHDHQH
jgi:copper(I)-binding protein